MTEKLYSWVSRSPMSLDQAIQTTQAQQMGANALLYSPQSCHLAQVQDGNICGSHGQSLPSATTLKPEFSMKPVNCVG